MGNCCSTDDGNGLLMDDDQNQINIDVLSKSQTIKSNSGRSRFS